MNELPIPPEASTAAGATNSAAAAAAAADSGAAGATHAQAKTRLRDTLRQPLVLAVIALAVLLAVQAWSSHKQISSLHEDMARRLHAGDLSNVATSAVVKSVQEANLELQVKVGVLESRQIEAQSQQLALEQLYQALSRTRDEWALTEIEQVLSTASQQLQLAANVPGALIALQNADRSLSHSDKPQFITIRRAIARDIEKLKALPSVDATGVALRIDAVVAQVDSLPMLSDEQPPLPAVSLKSASASGSASQSWLLKLKSVWRTWTSEMWLDVRQLIRIRSVDTPAALMLSPSQSYFLRENLKLRLLTARLALLARNESAFRSDLIAAQSALLKYFDTSAKATQTAQTLLRQVQGSNLAIEMPTLSDSLNAVRNYKAKP
ncbi:MAG: uroporphyrin-3 C-methyltransferase [Janthinobacterium sp.]|jgi:uroporphyrin-3 C-methyltransferase